MDEKIIAQLFTRFHAIYGRRWMSVFPNDGLLKIAKHEWGRILSGLEMADLTRGMAALNTRPEKDRGWPPSAPEFRLLCLPTAEQLGIPGKRESLSLANHGEYSHPVIAHVLRSIGSWRLGHMPEKEAHRVWGEAYDEFVSRAKEGEVFDWPPGMDPSRTLEHKESGTPADPDKARAALDRLKSELVGE